MSAEQMTAAPSLPSGSNTVNPFVIADDAAGLIAFLVEVFEAVEVPEARTADTDGLILHTELLVGDSVLTVADRKPDWVYTPALVRVYVDDVKAALDRAVARGARIVTEPTDFFGDTLSRFADPYGNLWWVYKHNPTNAWTDESDDDDADRSRGDTNDSWESFTSPDLEYIHSTLVEAMTSLSDPRSAG